MSANVVYEIARYDSGKDGTPLLELLQLLSGDGVLRLRDSSGSETPCEGTDIATVISATASLRDIRAGEQARISCAPEVAAQLPFVLKPVCDSGDCSGLEAKVNDAYWGAYPTLDGDYVMLPGGDPYEGPDMSPCWAEHSCQEGDFDQSPLVFDTSIGLATPGVAVEFGHYDHGGIGPDSGVAIRPLDDVATVVAGWLVNDEMLANLWGGDSVPYSPEFLVRLFAEAAAAPHHRSSWNTGVDDAEDEDGNDENYYSSADLKLHLSGALIDQVRARLSALDPAYAAILEAGGDAS